MNLNKFIFSAFLLFGSIAFSQVETEEIRAVVLATDFIDDVAGQVEGYTDPYSGSDFEFVVDPKEKVVNDEKDQSLEQLYELSKLMRSSEYQYYKNNNIILPVSTANSELLKNLEGLDNETLQQFLDRKGYYLRKVAKILAFFRLKSTRIDATLEKLNDAFFKRPKFVAGAESFVATPGVFVAAGLGLNDKILEALRKYPVLKHLPDKAGFYVALSFGVSLVYTKKANGKRGIRIEPGLDLRIGREFYSPYVLVAAGFTGMVSLESRQASNLTTLKADFVKASVATVVGGDNIMGFSLPFGINPLPGGASIAGIKGSFYRMQLTPSAVPILLRATKDFLVNGAKSCQRVVKKLF